eukprot:COSAG05_NODE_20058_length_283_cov_1.581522_1_plen_26_part_01
MLLLVASRYLGTVVSVFYCYEYSCTV